jgi:hypothetical protein
MHARNVLALVLPVLVVTTSTTRSMAQDHTEDGRERSVQLDLGGGTHVPVSVGGEAVVELPGRLLVGLHLGFMPAGYVRLMNEVATGFGWYDEQTASLIQSGLERSLILRASVGWRPFPRAGFELWGGYTLGALGGGLSAADLIEAVTGLPFPAAEGQEVPMRSNVHALHAAIGWRFVWVEHVVLRIGLGYLHAVGASTRIESADAGRSPWVVAAEDYLDDTFREYVQTIDARITLSYRI